MAEVTKAERLRMARRNAGFKSASQAAKALGVAVPTYVHHENGTRDFSNEAAGMYAAKYGASLQWILFGEGEMDGEKEQAIVLDPIEMTYGDEPDQATVEADRFDAFEVMLAIPLIAPVYAQASKVRSHQWSRFIDDKTQVTHPIATYFGIPEEYVSANLYSAEKDLILYPYFGDAMSPTYDHGDLLFVNTSTADLHADGVYLVADRNSVPQVRRVRRKIGSAPASAVLICDNPSIADVEVAISDLLIIGAVHGRITFRA